jgi:hypothetical protein
VVPYAPDHDTLQSLMSCEAPRPALFTDIAGGSHNVWGGVYDLSAGHGDIYAWLLANPKP